MTDGHQTAKREADLTELSGHLWQCVGSVTFDKDDAASIRAALVAARLRLMQEVWDLREHPGVAALCREVWADVLDTLLAYRFRAGLSDSECATHRAEILWFLPIYTTRWPPQPIV